MQSQFEISWHSTDKQRLIHTFRALVTYQEASEGDLLLACSILQQQPPFRPQQLYTVEDVDFRAGAKARGRTFSEQNFHAAHMKSSGLYLGSYSCIYCPPQLNPSLTSPKVPSLQPNVDSIAFELDSERGGGASAVVLDDHSKAIQDCPRKVLGGVMSELETDLAPAATPTSMTSFELKVHVEVKLRPHQKVEDESAPAAEIFDVLLYSPDMCGNFPSSSREVQSMVGGSLDCTSELLVTANAQWHALPGVPCLTLPVDTTHSQVCLVLRSHMKTLSTLSIQAGSLVGSPSPAASSPFSSLPQPKGPAEPGSQATSSVGHDEIGWELTYKWPDQCSVEGTVVDPYVRLITEVSSFRIEE